MNKEEKTLLIGLGVLILLLAGITVFWTWLRINHPITLFPLDPHATPTAAIGPAPTRRTPTRLRTQLPSPSCPPCETPRRWCPTCTAVPVPTVTPWPPYPTPELTPTPVPFVAKVYLPEVRK